MMPLTQTEMIDNLHLMHSENYFRCIKRKHTMMICFVLMQLN